MDNDKLYAVKISFLDSDHDRLKSEWLRNDEPYRDKDYCIFLFTEIDSEAHIFRNKEDATKIANEVRIKEPELYSVTVVEVKEVYRLEIVDIF